MSSSKQSHHLSIVSRIHSISHEAEYAYSTKITCIFSFFLFLKFFLKKKNGFSWKRLFWFRKNDLNIKIYWGIPIPIQSVLTFLNCIYFVKRKTLYIKKTKYSWIWVKYDSSIRQNSETKNAQRVFNSRMSGLLEGKDRSKVQKALTSYTWIFFIQARCEIV